MLNELALIRNGLRAVDEAALQIVHTDIRAPGKKDTMRVILNAQGSITELDLLEGERNKNYWSQGNGNQSKFPAIKLPFPLRPGGVEEFRQWSKKNQRPKIEDWFACIKDLRDKYQFKPAQETWPNYREKLQERSNIYAKLRGSSSIVHSLITVFLNIGNNGLLLLEDFDQMLWEKMENNTDKGLLKFASLVLFGAGKQKLPDGKRPTLLLDLITDDTTHSAANKHWKSDISKVLYEHEQLTNIPKQGKCVISGQENVNLISNTFPKAKCESLGEVIIFSRKDDVQTYKRYGKLAADSISVSADLADELKSALEYLNSKEQGTTWDLLPSEAGSNDLLITFCRDYPDVYTARLFTCEDALDETEYEIEASHICESFKGKDIELSKEIQN